MQKKKKTNCNLSQNYKSRQKKKRVKDVCTNVFPLNQIK